MIDLYDYERDLRQENSAHYIQFFIDNFERRQDVDPSFYFSYKMNEDNRLSHVLWAHGNVASIF